MQLAWLGRTYLRLYVARPHVPEVIRSHAAWDQSDTDGSSMGGGGQGSQKRESPQHGLGSITLRSVGVPIPAADVGRGGGGGGE